MRTDEQLKEQLTKLIGPQTYVDGRLNKAAVATFLLSSEANAHAIDAIVHPAVFRDFEESGLLWMESAIMFESGADRYVDNVVVVTAPEEVRIERIMKRDGISREKAQEWMQRQWPQEKVRQLAQYEIINDGRQDLDSQIADLLQKLSNTRNTHQLL
jgi:dephospho-CoA kinase